MAGAGRRRARKERRCTAMKRREGREEKEKDDHEG
jgi:hypothetical protein